MKEEFEDKKELITTDATANAVQVIKAAILQSQQRALKAINQEQLALYYGIGRYVSANTRKKNWGKGALAAISEQLRCSMFENRPLSADDLQNSIIPVGDKGHIEIRPLATDELPPETLDAFLNHGDFC